MKDYIIFDRVPILAFYTTDPFSCEETSFLDVESWYNAQSRDTPKPRPKIFCNLTTTNCSSEFELQNVSSSLSVHGNYTAYYRQKSFKLI